MSSPSSGDARSRGPTLGQAFGAGLAVLAILLAALVLILLASSRRSVVASAQALQTLVATQVAHAVDEELSAADRAVTDLDRQVSAGVLDTRDPAAVEAALFAVMLREAGLTEATLTLAAEVPGASDPVGEALGGSGRRQISVVRAAGATGSRLVTRHVVREGDRWVLELRDRASGASLTGAPLVRVATGAIPDPTDHPTFTVPTARWARGRALWSDLAYAEHDAHLPERARRKVLTVQRAIRDADGRLVGVARAGVLGAQIDEISRVRVVPDDPADPHRVFLFDGHGRPITRLSPDDRYETLDPLGRPHPEGDLRVVSARLPAPIAAALALRVPLDPGRPVVTRVHADGVDHLVALTALAPGRTHGWRIGVVVPEAYALRGLAASRDRLLLGAGLLALAVLVVGGQALRAVRRALGRIVRETERMRRFEFDPAPADAPFRDVREALTSLEQAKTALRALGRYVPVELVRQLYEGNQEPVVGSEPQDVTLLFTDVADFTRIAEALPPPVLATALGRYLEALTAEVQAAGGTVDKFVGDAVMALWNAPRPVADHPRRACEAALACVEATRRLYASTAWAGLPAWRTRFGLHRDTVLVGHFGAPDRLSFTAIGDGVNLASRLEGLNKRYGTEILVSESIAVEVGDDFVTRRLDRVAVKGRTRGIDVYELVGRRGEVDAGRVATLRRYEAALAAYQGGRFAVAAAILDSHRDDAPSRVLAERCRRLAAAPLAASWDGVVVAAEK